MNTPSPNIISNMIPCVTDHFAVFKNKEVKVIGWISRPKSEQIGGDVEKIAEVVGLVPYKDEVVVAEDQNDFIKYQRNSDFKNLEETNKGKAKV